MFLEEGSEWFVQQSKVTDKFVIVACMPKKPSQVFAGGWNRPGGHYSHLG
jgi:hypothetical protein